MEEQDVIQTNETYGILSEYIRARFEEVDKKSSSEIYILHYPKDAQESPESYIITPTDIDTASKDALIEYAEYSFPVSFLLNCSEHYREGSFSEIPFDTDIQGMVLELVPAANHYRYLLIKHNSKILINSLRFKLEKKDECLSHYFFAALNQACSATLNEPIKHSLYPIYSTNVMENAAKFLLRDICSTQNNAYFPLFYESCNDISAMLYEGEVGNGSLIISKPDNPQLIETIKLKNPVPLQRIRTARKILEISDSTLSIITDGFAIRSLGQVNKEPPADDANIFSIHFTGTGSWELRHNNNAVMQVKNRVPMFPQKRIEEEDFRRAICAVFKTISPKETSLLWEIISAATKQKHGTMLVISSQAKEEANRLANQCFPIEDMPLDKSNTQNITAIDGAVLLDTDGNCYALGVILDGEADPSQGSPARGARYNSALRYLHSAMKRKILTLLVVISEDGMIDVIPDLPRECEA